jgi:hypothetical protein
MSDNPAKRAAPLDARPGQGDLKYSDRADEISSASAVASSQTRGRRADHLM